MELPVVKATEFECKAAENPNQCELGGDIYDKAESRLFDEREAQFGFTLHL